MRFTKSALLWLSPGVLLIGASMRPEQGQRDELSSGHPPTPQDVETILSAVRRADKPQVEKLIRANPRILTAVDEDGYTPLHIAAAFGAVEIARLLIEKGAQVNAKDRYEETPLHEAARRGDAWLADLLLKNGAQVNAKDRASGHTFYASGMTPLHWAVSCGAADVTKLLLIKGADPDARDDDGQTPLHLWGYSAENALGVADALLAKGAYVNARTTGTHNVYTVDFPATSLRVLFGIPRGVTPLGVAVLAKKGEKITFLRQHGGEN